MLPRMVLVDPVSQLELDRLAVRNTLERYLVCLDRRDFPGLAACFTEDAEANFEVAPERLIGAHAIVDFLRTIENYSASTHAWGNVSIVVQGDGAESDLFVVATLLRGPAATGRISVRGVRYQDRLVRSSGGWLIAERVHSALWQYDVVARAPFSAEATRRDG